MMFGPLFPENFRVRIISGPGANLYAGVGVPAPPPANFPPAGEILHFDDPGFVEGMFHEPSTVDFDIGYADLFRRMAKELQPDFVGSYRGIENDADIRFPVFADLGYREMARVPPIIGFPLVTDSNQEMLEVVIGPVRKRSERHLPDEEFTTQTQHHPPKGSGPGPRNSQGQRRAMSGR